MFRLTSPQLPLFEATIMFPDILPKNDWCYIYRDKIYPLIDETKFQHLYAEKGGAPNKSIKTQVSILIFLGMEKLNWRQAEFQFSRRIDWMIATHTEFGKAFIDHTTLFKFFQRLENDKSAYKLFCDLTDAFIKECGVSLKKQRVDSFFMYGWLEILSRYGLFKETNRVFLQALRKHKPGLYEDIRSDLSRDYLETTFDLTEKDREKANRNIKQMAKDLYLLKSSFENHRQIRHYESFKTLVQVFEQQCVVKKQSYASEEKSDDLSPEVEIREKPEGDKIISSPHNTDAEYTRKRKQKVTGHKGFVTETCDPENQVQFITDANLERATHSDSAELPELEKRLDENGFNPVDLHGDAGFVNGKTILESEKNEINLAGPSSGRSQSIESFQDEDRPLDIADYEVKIDDKTNEIIVLSCPNKQEPLDQKRSKKGHILVHFNRDVCEQCPLRDRCPVKIGARISTLTVDEEQYAGASRHHKYMSDTEYRKECSTRAGAESLVNEIANAHGARKSRHRNEARSRLQLIFASIGCNVKRYIKYKAKCAQNQPRLAEVRG